MNEYDVVVIGGGAAGLAAAIAAKKAGARVLLIEREQRLGGILKQCIHDGFGLIHFGEKLSGPEYVERFIAAFNLLGIDALTHTFVINISAGGAQTSSHVGVQKKITYVNSGGVASILTKALVLATGCRERTARQVFIHGTRPSGIFTAGTAQHFINLLGELPAKRCVILGSGDIGLIMARRLTLEGAQVLGVYEAKSEPSGLTRNIVQCLEDFSIPLYLSHTVTRVFGDERLRAVEVCRVDEKMKPIKGTEKIIDCDALILSVGLIPENEIAESLGVALDARTKGPACDSHFMTSVPGVFSCGNALHVNDLVDYVTESGNASGNAAALWARSFCADTVPAASPLPEYVPLKADASLLYMVPQFLERKNCANPLRLYFRTSVPRKKTRLVFKSGGRELFSKQYANVKPPEMVRLEIDVSRLHLDMCDIIEVSLENVVDVVACEASVRRTQHDDVHGATDEADASSGAQSVRECGANGAVPKAHTEAV
ncbi:MAG: FAD-dependent oxidoreductase [Treponema sp.]|nr:FAD-dependent oxidoreductase [Treponema sp.]